MVFSGISGGASTQDALSDHAVVQAMLDVELALSRALVHCGLAPAAAAEELAPACDATAFDLECLARCASGSARTPPRTFTAARPARTLSTRRSCWSRAAH